MDEKNHHTEDDIIVDTFKMASHAASILGAITGNVPLQAAGEIGDAIVSANDMANKYDSSASQLDNPSRNISHQYQAPSEETLGSHYAETNFAQSEGDTSDLWTTTQPDFDIGNPFQNFLGQAIYGNDQISHSSEHQYDESDGDADDTDFDLGIFFGL